MTKPIVDNAASGSFIDLSFLDSTNILNRMTKQSRVWHTRDSIVASPTVAGGITAEQCIRNEERDQGMIHLKMQMDLLAKHLLSDKTEMVKAVESQGTVSIGADAKANYVSN